MQIKTLMFLLLLASTALFSQQSTPFYLLSPTHSTSLFIDPKEKQVVKTAVELFSSDMKTVGDAKIKVYNRYTIEPSCLIVAGTIGCNPFIDSLISKGLLSVDEINNKWEAFKIKVFDQKNSQQKILLVVGSDSRGTAYGILELSRLAGVSPWNWWADVSPIKQESVAINADINIVQSPSVQYRGIFINDEDWGITPWATKTFDKSSAKGAFGPLAYEKVFELLLRLRANTIWPAMHTCTAPFYSVKGNKEIADRYGIVVGTSHCEPMMSCSASEWHLRGVGEYNYAVNDQNVNSFWTDRVNELSASENIYTLGMRGLHDGKMLGANTVDEQVELTNTVLKTQRELITHNLNPNPTKIPQVFIPYKEVLEIYNSGKLNLPEDISLIWCDDNYGYISRLSNLEEQKRSGGSGVYYHASYYGAPHDYLWLCSTPPAQVYTEMKRAWDYNARKLWILNVGDLKPTEYITELFLDLAWNINCVKNDSVQSHTQNWIAREFGLDHASEIADIIKQYYHLGTIRKPEHMGWSQIQVKGYPKGLTPIVNTEFNPFAFGNELKKRVSDYQQIEDQVEQLSQKIDLNRKDAFFELVQYPVQGASLLNKKLLYAQMYNILAALNLPSANEYSKLSSSSYQKIQQLTDVYNHQIADGKWNGMMDAKPRNLPVFQKIQFSEIPVSERNGIVLFANGFDTPISGGSTTTVPTFAQSAKNNYQLTIFKKGNTTSNWSITKKPEWLNLEIDSLKMKGETTVLLQIDWKKTKERFSTDQLVLQCGSEQYRFNLTAQQFEKEGLSRQMIDDCDSFNATEYQKPSIGKVKEIVGLGHSGVALEIQTIGDKSAALEYPFMTQKTGKISVCVAVYPNHPAISKNKRYAVSIDDEKPQIIETETDIFKEDWKINVLRNQTRTTSKHFISKKGKHVLKIYAIDPDIILDQIFIDFNVNRKFYQIPE